jgi:hypothetical protein
LNDEDEDEVLRSLPSGVRVWYLGLPPRVVFLHALALSRGTLSVYAPRFLISSPRYRESAATPIGNQEPEISSITRLVKASSMRLRYIVLFSLGALAYGQVGSGKQQSGAATSRLQSKLAVPPRLRPSSVQDIAVINQDDIHTTEQGISRAPQIERRHGHHSRAVVVSAGVPQMALVINAD